MEIIFILSFNPVSAHSHSALKWRVESVWVKERPGGRCLQALWWRNVKYITHMLKIILSAHTLIWQSFAQKHTGKECLIKLDT